MSLISTGSISLDSTFKHYNINAVLHNAKAIFTMFTCEFGEASLGTGSTCAPQFSEVSEAVAQQTGQQEPHR